MERYNFKKTFADFLNERSIIPKNYGYDSIVIGAYTLEDFNYITDYLNDTFNLDNLNYSNHFRYYIEGEEKLYFRLDIEYMNLTFGPLDEVEYLAKTVGFTYEKVFTVDDIKRGVIDNIIKTGVSKQTAKQLYTPKQIIREDLLLEKSSLTRLGVPNYVMRHIQRDFAIPADAEWKRIRLKSDAKDILRDGKKEFLIQLSLHSIKVFVSYEKDGDRMFFVDNYIFREGAWGGEYERQQREYLTMTQMFYKIKTESLIYHLQDDFSLIRQPARKRKKAQKEFTEFTEQFKKDFLKNFESILRRLVGAKYKSAKKDIQEKARRVEIENQMMLSGLSDPLSGPNSLTILDEFLLGFEEEYSNYFGERLDIQELSEYFTRDKIMTSFMYYIYTGKILDK